MKTITPGNVIRWFCIDWEFFGSPTKATEMQDDIFDALLNMRNAVEVNSGHTGVNVAFENIKRSDQSAIKEIKQRLQKFVQK